jgi:hypothetical protein
VSGPITTVSVPAHHLDLLRKPAVDVVAAHIAGALGGAAKAPVGPTTTDPSG